MRMSAPNSAGPRAAVFLVHGGPESQLRPIFNPTIQFLTQRGFVVVAPNVRGSSGYGKEYLHLDDVELRMWGQALSDYRARRWEEALPVLATRQNLSAAGFEAAERGIRLFRRAGLSPSRSLDMLSVCFSFLIGHALAEVGRPPLQAADVSAEAFEEALAASEAAYPDLVAAIRSKRDLEDMDEVWRTGVRALITSIETTARRRRA